MPGAGVYAENRKLPEIVRASQVSRAVLALTKLTNMWSREERLVLACARSTLTSADRSTLLQEVGQPIDWDSAWQLACAHGVSYFFHRHFNDLVSTSRVASSLVPSDFLRRMKQEGAAAAAHCLLLLRAQQELAADLERRDVPHAWLKGLALSEQLYGRPEARTPQDLDLLIAPTEQSTLTHWLHARDWQPFHHSRPGKDLHPLGRYHEIWCRRSQAGPLVLLEVHHQLAGPAACQPSASDLLQLPRTQKLGSASVRVLRLEAELLMLCIHAHHHNFAVLRTLMDLVEWVRVSGAGVDWERLSADAGRTHCGGRLWSALMVAHRLLEGSAPSVAVPIPSSLGPLQRQVQQHLSARRLLNPEMEQSEAQRLLLTVFMDRWSDVARSLAPRLLPPADYLRQLWPQPGPRWRGFAYLAYLQRVCRQVHHSTQPSLPEGQVKERCRSSNGSS